MSKYSAMNHSDDVVKLLPAHEKLLKEAKDIAQKRNDLGSHYNDEVRRVNKMMFYEMQKYVKERLKLAK